MSQATSKSKVGRTRATYVSRLGPKYFCFVFLNSDASTESQTFKLKKDKFDLKNENFRTV